MKIINVIDVDGREVKVNEDTKKLHSFSNSKKVITYNAEIVEDGKGTGFWTDYTVTGVVEDVEERLDMWNNHLRFIYANTVSFNASKNDPDKKIWNKFVEFVKENEEKFFTKKGDFRAKYLVSDREISALAKGVK